MLLDTEYIEEIYYTVIRFAAKLSDCEVKEHLQVIVWNVTFSLRRVALATYVKFKFIDGDSSLTNN